MWMIGDPDFLFVRPGDAPSRPLNTSNIHELYEMKLNIIKQCVLYKALHLQCTQFRIHIFYSTHTVGSILFTVHAVWDAYCLQCTHCGIHIVYSAHTVGSILFTVHTLWDPYSLQCTQCGIHIFYSAQSWCCIFRECALYGIHIVYSLHTVGPILFTDCIDITVYIWTVGRCI